MTAAPHSLNLKAVLAAAILTVSAAWWTAASAQDAGPAAQEFRVEMLATLQEAAVQNPNDPLYRIALDIVDANPVIFQAVADRAMQAKGQNPSVVIEGNWLQPYYVEMVNALIGLRGEMIASAPLDRLLEFNGRWVEYLHFMQQHSAELCASEIGGTKLTARPDQFAAATGSDEALLRDFVRLSTQVVYETARSILAGQEAQLEGEIAGDDIEVLKSTLVADGFSEADADAIVEGDFGTDAAAAERCASGVRFYEALADLPEENRRELMAFYLVAR